MTSPEEKLQCKQMKLGVWGTFSPQSQKVLLCKMTTEMVWAILGGAVNWASGFGDFWPNLKSCPYFSTAVAPVCSGDFE